LPDNVSVEQKHDDSNIDLAKESLTQLLGDDRVPDSVRDLLAEEYQQLQA